jgi:cytidine deaminase
MPFQSIDDPAWQPLLKAAWNARAHAYAPYSGFQVGAALAWAGNLVSGCNVENASYPICICAERTALGAAVTAGMKPDEPLALVVVTEAASLTPPCGACRQALAEFSLELPILLDNGHERQLHRLGDLLPSAFTRLNLI